MQRSATTRVCDPPDLAWGPAAVISAIPDLAGRVAAATSLWPDFARFCQRVPDDLESVWNLPLSWAEIVLRCLPHQAAQAALEAGPRTYSGALYQQLQLPLAVRELLQRPGPLTDPVTAKTAIDWIRHDTDADLREKQWLFTRLLQAYEQRLDEHDDTRTLTDHIAPQSWRDPTRTLDPGEAAMAALYIDVLYNSHPCPPAELPLWLSGAWPTTAGNITLPRAWLTGSAPLGPHALEALWRIGPCPDDVEWLVTAIGLDVHAHAWALEMLCAATPTDGPAHPRDGLHPPMTFLLADRLLPVATKHAHAGPCKFVPTDTERADLVHAPDTGTLVALLFDETRATWVLESLLHDPADHDGVYFDDPRCVPRLAAFLGPDAGDHLSGPALLEWMHELDDADLRRWLSTRDTDSVFDALYERVDDYDGLLARIVRFTPGVFAVQHYAGLLDRAAESIADICRDELGTDPTSWALLFQIGPEFPGPLDELLATVRQCRR